MSTHHLDSLAGTPVIIGAGIAGLAVALSLSPRPVILLNKTSFGHGNTEWAQGGVAAALGEDDSPALHAADTIRVGAGLVDSPIAKLIAGAATGAIEMLECWGVAFDRDGAAFALGLEAGHSRRRIVHAGGDATGFAIMQALTQAALQTSSVTMLEARAVRIHAPEGQVVGLTLQLQDDVRFFSTSYAVLATGGIGQLYAHTTNPPGATGDGLFLGAEAGAVLADLEFVQFHPTAMALGRDPTPLATEALRGDGARLVRGNGDYLLTSDLAPRHVVSRAIWDALSQGDEIRLDCRAVPNLSQRFPSVYKICLEAGIDLAITPVPVRPAAHFHMGGVETDDRGRTSIEGLWACGEVACTRLHGANRLASNSLLEATVMAGRVAEDIAGRESAVPASETAEKPAPRTTQSYRALMDRRVGVVRNGADLEIALKELSPGFRAKYPPAVISFLIALMALERRESRGAHLRSDYPGPLDAEHSRITLGQAEERAQSFFMSS